VALRNQRPGDDELASNANRKHSGRWATEKTCKHHGDGIGWNDMDACCWLFPMNGVDKWGDDNVFIYTSSHRFLSNGTGLVLHLTDQLDTAFAWNQIILATLNDLYILCTERRFAKMQTICRPCHSQACQCSALIDEGEEVIQCTLKSGFGPDFDDMFECNWLRQQVHLHFGKPVSHFKVWGFLWSIHCFSKGGLLAPTQKRGAYVKRFR